MLPANSRLGIFIASPTSDALYTFLLCLSKYPIIPARIPCTSSNIIRRVDILSMCITEYLALASYTGHGKT